MLIAQKWLCFGIVVVLISGCKFRAELNEGEGHWPCRLEDENPCRSGCVCLDGQVCVPQEETESDQVDCSFCDYPLADCNRNFKDGCEVNLRFDLENCGSCGNQCRVVDGEAICIEGKCSIRSCHDPHQDCDSDYFTGCEVNTQLDQNHCGFCGWACNSPPVGTCGLDGWVEYYSEWGECLGGQCEYSSMSMECPLGCEGWMCRSNCQDATCDPSEVCIGGQCRCGSTGPDCDQAETCCGNACVDLQTNPNHCGACNHECAYGVACYQGRCGLQGARCGGTFCHTDASTSDDLVCCLIEEQLQCVPPDDCGQLILHCDGIEDCNGAICCLGRVNLNYMTQCLGANTNCQGEIMCNSDRECKELVGDGSICCPLEVLSVFIGNACMSMYECL